MKRVFGWAWKRAIAGRPRALTRVFWAWIPFNKPHRFAIVELEVGRAVVAAPSRRWNQNHLGTQHACSLATIGEFAAGLSLLGAFSPEAYRLIMSRLEVDYTRRAQGRVEACAEVTSESLAAFREELASSGIARVVVETALSDGGGEQVARVRTHWQVKSWSKISP